MRENGFTLAQARSRQYLARTFTGTNYANDIERLTNTPAQAESQLHCLQRATGGIGLHINAEKNRDHVL